MKIDWETWLVEEGGDQVIQKEAAAGRAALTPAERLTYCLWVADYGMLNAGDLETAEDLHPGFQAEAAEIARTLDLPKTTAAFSLAPVELQQVYFDVFDDICLEVSTALGSPQQPTS